MNAPRDGLTERECELLPYLAEGLTTEQIAEALTVSAETVKSHVRHIMAKTGIHNRRELGRAIRAGGGGRLAGSHRRVRRGGRKITRYGGCVMARVGFGLQSVWIKEGCP